MCAKLYPRTAAFKVRFPNEAQQSFLGEMQILGSHSPPTNRIIGLSHSRSLPLSNVSMGDRPIK